MQTAMFGGMRVYWNEGTICPHLTKWVRVKDAVGTEKGKRPIFYKVLLCGKCGKTLKDNL